MPMSSLVSDSDSREKTPFRVSTGTNLNCSRVRSPLPPTVIPVRLTSTTRPANTRLASPNAGSKSKPRNHSSCAIDFAGQARSTDRRQMQTIGRARRFTGRYLAFMVRALAHPSRLGSISRQEQAIRQWKKERWPEVKKNRKEGRIIYLHRRRRIEREPSLSHSSPCGNDRSRTQET